MKKFRTVLSAATFALALGATGISQATIFSDNFNAENGGVGALNFSAFTNWTVTGGTVDLIGNGFYDFLPGNGLYIDMDGSTGNAGILGHLLEGVAAPGSYQLSFDLAGNQRNGAAELTTATVAILSGGGTAASQNYTLAQGVGFTTYTINFQLDGTINPADVLISFGAAGGDNVGMLLDNVSVAAIPEPEIYAMMAAGLGLMGFVVRRRQRNGAVA